MTTDSRLFDHAVALYELLEKDSKDGVWEGKIVQTFRSLNISQTYYTPLFSILSELGSITQERRGTALAPHRIRLHHAPKIDEFEKVFRGHLTKRASSDTILEQRISNLERRVPEVDLTSIIQNFQERLSELEREVQNLAKTA